MHAEHDIQQLLTNVVAAAVMAPSSHNTQPWRFRIIGGALEILADFRRHLTVIDGDRRQLFQSCGCALFNARVALRAMGYEDVVAIGGDRELVATLRPGRRIISTDEDLALMRAIPLRRTNRRAFVDRPVGRDHADRLIAAAVRHGVWAVRLDPVQKRAVGALVDLADRRQFGDPGFREELAGWLATPGSRRRDGIPFIEKEYGSAIPFTVHRKLRSPDLGEDFGHLEDERVRASPVVLVLGTHTDDPTSWIAAGQALEAVLLEATALELSAAFANQVLEVPDLRGELAGVVGRDGFPQMVLRIGYASEPVRHAAPRRDLGDVLLVVD